MREPGLDRHDWESEWEALEPLVVDSPAEALPELDDLVGRMMAERGYPLSVEEAEVQKLEEPEVLVEYLEAKRIAETAERGEDVDPGDVGAAVTAYRNLYEYLLRQPRTEGGE